MTTPISAERQRKERERKRKERERHKGQGLIRRDVKAHADDWPEIRELELKLKAKRLKQSLKQ